MKVEKLVREFKYGSLALADPDPTQTPEEVKAFYAGMYPELNNAEINGPDNKGGKAVYEFRKAVGTKGAARRFHLGDILSITTGQLVSPRHIDGVYDILNYMTSDNLFTHQLPRASRECAPYLLKQHPALAGLDTTDVGPQTWRSWLDAQVRKFGETLPVEPLPAHAHEFIDPMSELAEKVHPDRIIPIMVKP